MNLSRDQHGTSRSATSVLACITFTLSVSAVAQSLDGETRIRLDQIADMDVSSIGNRVVAAEHAGQIVVWDSETGIVMNLITVEENLSGAPACIRFIDTSSALLLLDNVGTVTIWNLENGSVAHRYHLWDESFITQCDASPSDDGVNLLVYTSAGHSIYHLDNTVKRVAQFEGQPYGDTSLFAPAGKQLLIASNNVPDVLYEVASKKKVRNFDFPFQAHAVAFSPDASLIATGTYTGTIDVWDAQSGKRVDALVRKVTHTQSPSDPGMRVHDLAFSGDGKRLAAARGTIVTKWDIDTRRELDSWHIGAGSTKVAFAGGGSQLIAGTTNGLALLDAGKQKRQLELLQTAMTRTTDRLASWSDRVGPLFAAINDQDMEKVATLLADGADPNLVDTIGATPLWLAAVKRNPQVVQLLLDAGARVNGKSIGNQTALWMAAQQRDMEVARILIGAGAEINAQIAFGGGSALQWAAHVGHKEFVTLLLELGADPNLRRENGDTALMLARRNGHQEIVEMLKIAGAEE